MLPSDAIFELKIHQNAFAAHCMGTGGAYSAPDRLADFQEPLRDRGGDGSEGGEERMKKEWRWSLLPRLFYNLTTGYA